jgi:hypothetical protein
VTEQLWRYELWDRTTGYTGRNLTGARSGTLGWQKNQAIKGQGSLDVKQTDDGDLLNVLIRPVLTLDGDDHPYGLWVPSFPKKSFVSSGWTGTVDLVSQEAILSYTSAASVLNTDNSITVSITTGTVLTDWISDFLTAMGFRQFAVQASTKTADTPLSWTNGETALQVINSVLQDSLGYASIYSDMDGTLRCDPYVLPADRAESFKQQRPFDVTGNPRFLTAFDFTSNAPNVPNQVRAVGQPVGWLPGQTAVSVNNDPTSPYSVQNRGYVVEKVYNDVSALSQDAVQAYAHQQLLNLSKDGRKAEVKFLHLPGVALNQVVRFNTPRAGDPMFATVDALSVDTSPTGTSSATLTAVTAVQDDTVE